jgi:glycosyltransferase involved in cell wall biosynthesis
LFATGTLDVGGLEEVVAFLARELRPHGIKTAVLHAARSDDPAGTPAGPMGRMLQAQGIETTQRGADLGVQWLEQWRPDVISTHGAPDWVLRAANRLRIPCVETLHMPAFMIERPEAEAERAHRLSGIVAVSDLLRRQYLNLNPAFPPDRIVTIPNAVDASRCIPMDRAAARTRWGIGDQYVFLSLARHSLQKNAYGLVAAFADLAGRHPEAHLIIAGRPDTPAYLSQVARLRDGLACRDRIHLRDHYPDPSELLALADGFVLDSFFEGWSLASMEALCIGVPVVLSDVAGAREQVGLDGARGHVVANPAGDALHINWETIRAARFARQGNREALVEAMSSLVAGRHERLDARDELRAESATRFRPDVCARRHMLALRVAVDGHGMPSQTTLDDLGPHPGSSGSHDSVEMRSPPRRVK